MALMWRARLSVLVASGVPSRTCAGDAVALLPSINSTVTSGGETKSSEISLLQLYL